MVGLAEPDSYSETSEGRASADCLAQGLGNGYAVASALRKRSELSRVMGALARLLLVYQSLMALAELRVREERKGWGW
jgi:hypothetical protein